MMIYKPHLAVMLPFALLAGRRWLVVFVTGATAALLVAISVAVYGVDVWLQYQHNISVLRTVILEDGTGVSHRMVSVFVFARHLGAGVAVSYGWQAVAALVAAVFIVRSWWRDEPAHIRNAVLLVGTCLATPYLMDYDLVFGAFVVVWLLKAEKDFRALAAAHSRSRRRDLAAAVAERTDRKTRPGHRSDRWSFFPYSRS